MVLFDVVELERCLEINVQQRMSTMRLLNINPRLPLLAPDNVGPRSHNPRWAANEDSLLNVQRSNLLLPI